MALTPRRMPDIVATESLPHPENLCNPESSNQVQIQIVAYFMASTSYPGHFAPASLKPWRPRWRKLPNSRSPGHFAPASLKHHLEPRAHPRERRYPGHFAPASLKPARYGVDVVPGLELSGAFRPGLIEARGFRCSYRKLSQVIRGISPRPH